MLAAVAANERRLPQDARALAAAMAGKWYGGGGDGDGSGVYRLTMRPRDSRRQVAAVASSGQIVTYIAAPACCL